MRRVLVFMVPAMLAGSASAQDAQVVTPDTATSAPVVAPDTAASAPVVAPDTAASAPVVAPDTAVQDTGETEGARVEISGKVQLDFIYDFNRVAPDWKTTLRPSTIPVNCPGDAGCGKDGEAIFSVRQTSLAIKGFVPTALGELKTEMSLDLFNVGGANTGFRLLNAWAELGQWGAGQTYTLFMNADSFPNTIDYWGPNGMSFVRNPQVRYTALNSEGSKLAFSLEAPNAAIDTGKLTVAAENLGVQGRTLLPDLVAKYSMDGAAGHVEAAGLLRAVGFESAATPDNEPSGTKVGWGVNLNGWYNIGEKDRIIGTFVYGQGIASYMNDGGVDLAPGSDLEAETVTSLGWFVYYDHYWSETLSSSIGASQHWQFTTDGQLDTAFKTGSYASVNLLCRPVKNVMAGVELLAGMLKLKGGESGHDIRPQLTAQYKF